MARPKVSRSMEAQVVHLFYKEGYRIRRIAKTLKLSRNTVRSILRDHPVAESERQIPVWAKAIDWERVKQEYHRGVTIKILQKESAPEITYKVFWNHFRSLVPAPTESVTIRLNHKPGEKTFFDFADGIDIVDRKTGEITTTQLFSAVLPFSSLVAPGGHPKPATRGHLKTGQRNPPGRIG